MPRKRMIHPDLWADEEVGHLSRDARLLWIAMFSLADDEGRGTASAAYLRRAVFGFDDDVTQEMVAGWRGEIASTMRGVQFYTIDGRELYALLNWGRFQKVQHSTPSVIPVPPTATNGGTASTKECTDSTNGIQDRLGKVRLDQVRIGESDSVPGTPPPPPPKDDPAFSALWTLLTKEHIVTQVSDVLRDDVGTLFAMCGDGRIWRDAVLRAKSRDPVNANWALLRRIMDDYIKTGSFDKVPKSNGHSPPGKPPPRAISGLSEADLEVQRELQRAKAQRTTSGPAPPA
jgi:hypothetical protein